MTVPSLSIVVTGRNDNYGGDFNERFFSALQFNLDRLCEHGVSCEVALEDPSNHVRQPVLRPPLFSGGSGDFALAHRETMHALRGYNEVYRAARVGIDLNFLVKAYGAGCTLVDIGGPVYHINHVGS